MDRLEKAKHDLQQCYDAFNKAVEKDLPAFSLDNSDSLVHILNVVIRRESHSVLKKTKFPSKLSVELRRSVADMLLLVDGVDVKTIKQNAKAAQVEKAAD